MRCLKLIVGIVQGGEIHMTLGWIVFLALFVLSAIISLKVWLIMKWVNKDSDD